MDTRYTCIYTPLNTLYKCTTKWCTRYLDKDGDNMIDYDEFLEIYDFEAHNPTKKVHGSIDRMTKLLQQHFERLTREGADPGEFE